MTQVVGTAPGLGQVAGVVRSVETGRPVVNARVVVVSGQSSTLTDSGGRYRLTLAPQRYHLRFEAAGHVPVTLAVVVTEGVDQAVDVDLAPSVTRLAPLVVRARRSGSVDTPGDFGADDPGPAWARLALPGVDNLESMLADAPGGARRGVDGGTLHFQGGDADQNVVRLDGFPLLSASHFSPASSAVNPDLIRAATIRMGAPPARDGGWLSATVDLTSSLAAADALQLRGAVTSTDVRQLAAGPLLGSGGRFLLSGRRSFRNVLGDPAASESPNGYEDWLGSAGAAAGNGWAQVLVFRNRNQFAFPSRVEGGTADDGTDVGARPADPNAVEWSATTVGASWRGSWQGTAVTARAWSASTGAAVDWRSETNPVRLDSRFAEHGVQIDGARVAGGGWLGFGAAWIRDASSYEAGSLRAVSPTLSAATGSDQAVGYIEANLPVRTWLRTRIGVRASLLGWRRVAIDPRDRYRGPTDRAYTPSPHRGADPPVRPVPSQPGVVPQQLHGLRVARSGRRGGCSARLGGQLHARRGSWRESRTDDRRRSLPPPVRGVAARRAADRTAVRGKPLRHRDRGGCRGPAAVELRGSALRLRSVIRRRVVASPARGRRLRARISSAATASPCARSACRPGPRR